MDAYEAFHVSNKDATIAFQDRLISHGPIGQVAYGLFRAQKRSGRAKGYRRGSHRSNSYAAKNDALRYLDASLTQWGDELNISWGWQRDDAQDYHNQVLYVKTKRGQISFHSDRAHSEKRFDGKWDGKRNSERNTIRFCDEALTYPQTGLTTESLMPFGKHNGTPIGELDSGYVDYIVGWDGLSCWPNLQSFLQSIRDENQVSKRVQA